MFWWLELYEGPQLWTASISIPHLGHIPVLVSTESTNWTPIDIFQVMAFRIYGSTRKHVRMPQFFWISRHSRGRTEILMRTRRSRMLIIMMMIDHGDQWLRMIMILCSFWTLADQQKLFSLSRGFLLTQKCSTLLRPCPTKAMHQ